MTDARSWTTRDVVRVTAEQYGWSREGNGFEDMMLRHGANHVAHLTFGSRGQLTYALMDRDLHQGAGRKEAVLAYLQQHGTAQEVEGVATVQTSHTALVEVHGNSGSYINAAETFVRKQIPGAQVTGSRFAPDGQRCSHGNLLVEVTYTLDEEEVNG